LAISHARLVARQLHIRESRMLGYWKHPSETAFLTHWMQARSIGPNCAVPTVSAKARISCRAAVVTLANPVPRKCNASSSPTRLESPPKWRRTLTGMSFHSSLHCLARCGSSGLQDPDSSARHILRLLAFGAAVFSILIVLYTRSLQRAQQVQLDMKNGSSRWQTTFRKSSG